jgi:hypothetical protein
MIMLRPRFRRIAFVLVLATPELALAAPDPSRAPLIESLSGDAKEAFSSAEILFNNNDYDGAMTKYGQAYDLSKDPRLLFNMAVCARNLKRYARMQSLLTRYAREAGSAMAPDVRANVEGALAAIRNLVGGLRLAVSEDGATVAVDGQTIGITPLPEAIVVDLGERKLAVSKPGFKPFERTVVVQGGSEVPVAVTLSPAPHVGQLVVIAGDDTNIVVDGQAIAKGRFDGELMSGTHDLQITAPGKVTYRAQLELHDGEARTIQVSLESERHGAAIWPWIAGGAAVAVGAAVGGYFLFRSPQEVPAPLSATLGTVRFTSLGPR